MHYATEMRVLQGLCKLAHALDTVDYRHFLAAVVTHSLQHIRKRKLLT
jgi:hypothetical protein